MAAEDTTLAAFYSNWKGYQDHLKEVIAPLSAEELELRAAPGLRTLAELVEHIIATRVAWFARFLGEDVGEASAFMEWREPGAPAFSADQLVRGIDASWTVMENALRRWVPQQMGEEVQGRDWRGQPLSLSRNWVVWHVIEHDLHHGGEVSLTLGIHGLPAPDI